ncbi:hypothetical protein PFISCL1PPCAC_4861 [Pristionchus fissidentatus]|uniref:Uncharacterized protein n=1 Tax=Pristionchus fissidentatus TaxID=1538716 RepID=A0AAV5V2D5_9BILA|nr:hypothetical protein PFISCL1PPCAC_4861 [Pristionchus fissidentatus]
MFLTLLFILLSSCLIDSKPLADINFQSAIRELESLSTNSRDFLNYIYFWTILITLITFVLVSMICCIFGVLIYMIYQCVNSIVRCAKNPNTSSKSN